MAKSRKKSILRQTPDQTEPIPTTHNYWHCMTSTNREPLYSEPHECKIGIYGWRKKFLYILIIIIAALVVLNAALTLWIVSVLNFSMYGLANMRIDSDGLTLNGNAFIDDHLFATTISSRKGQTLRILSDDNLTLISRNDMSGQMGNKLSLGNSVVGVTANDFRINGRDRRLLFAVDEHKVTIATDTLKVDNLSGLRFSRSIQTPLIQSTGHSNLRLIAPERRASIVAPISIALESRLGDVSAISLKDLKFKSNEGKITFEANNIQLRNLEPTIPTTSTSSSIPQSHIIYPNVPVYQLCVCADSGKIFIAPSDQVCEANETICGPRYTTQTLNT
ncbi:zeta-sarcoglycan-like [Oppia nitens]|uniref:zeta-sarcoglycan-like n=1 Tax=Oppia nitens TaxID=1686743 RepID=UPI0023DA7B0F|nr:zeta-sarcoglycan-like [Oppia nitens]